ncbi:MAG: hypothetical protein QW545_07675 [Thermosphaera sp.]
MVNYLEGDCVTDVIINEKLVVENRMVKTLDEVRVLKELLDREEEIKEKFTELAKQLKARLQSPSQSDL